MNPVKGYYSLVQFCPDLSRMEAVNVGVVLFVPERMFVGVQVSAGNDRVKRFFGKDGIDLPQLTALKASLAERLNAEAGRFQTLEDLQSYISTRGNELILTAPRFVKVTRPDEQLEKLYQSLVGGRQLGNKPASFRRELRHRFRQAGLLERKIVEDVPVKVPAFHETITVPYAFQNGKFNLIQPVRFAGVERETVISRACRLAVEGESISTADHPRYGPMQLFLVAKFAAHQHDEQSTVRSILTGKPVRLFVESDTEKLIDEIRATGRDISDLPRWG